MEAHVAQIIQQKMLVPRVNLYCRCARLSTQTLNLADIELSLPVGSTTPKGQTSANKLC
jgi:hypothetical protein